MYHSLDLKLLYTTTPGPLCEITSFLTNRRGSGLAINLPQACEHVRLDGRSGGGDHNHLGVGADGARLLYPLV